VFRPGRCFCRARVTTLPPLSRDTEPTAIHHYCPFSVIVIIPAVIEPAKVAITQLHQAFLIKAAAVESIAFQPRERLGLTRCIVVQSPPADAGGPSESHPAPVSTDGHGWRHRSSNGYIRGSYNRRICGSWRLTLPEKVTAVVRCRTGNGAGGSAVKRTWRVDH
jgi:hypothetical protein